MVAFHAGFGGMVGGYLGVSTFFTLSGFLIASLLFAQGSPEEGIVLRGFWGRRFRRLFPAAVLTIIAVLALFAPFVATPDQLSTLRWDSIASLFSVANWQFIAQGSSYGDLFVAPSPLLHFWSLAIEEQFYIVFPLLLWAVIKAFGARRGLVAGVLLALAGGSLAWTLFGGLSNDHIYLGTGTRASELLLGGVLAVVLTKQRTRQVLAEVRPLRLLVVGAGAVALGVQLWWWWSVDQASEWLYRGGFTLYAGLTCVVILAAALPGGPVNRMTSAAPLRWLGARSYAIYLVHWPLFLVARQTWGDANRWLVTAGVVASSLLIADLSLRLLERPVRVKALFPSRRKAYAAMGVAALAVVLLAFTVVPDDPDGTSPDFESELETWEELLAAGADEASSDRATTTTEAPPSDPEDPAPPPPAPVPVVGLFGDSTSLSMSIGLSRWRDETGLLGPLVGDLRFGCGVPRFVKLRAETTVVPDVECLAWPQRWTEITAATRPHISLLSSPAWAVPDAVVPGEVDYSALGDPLVDDFVRGELLQAVDILSATGTQVVLVNWPQYGSWYDDGRSSAVQRQADPARMARLHEIQREVAALRPDSATVLEFGDWLGARSEDRALRADGMHFTEDEFTRVAHEWFGAEVVRIWEQRWDRMQELERARVQEQAAGASTTGSTSETG
ncbi:MAG: acyltransferase [Actinomycetia bacterium]|nr:acyltransferase [Actinomycetes bacterium]